MWNAGLSRDDWKAMDVISEIQDYGTVSWSGRNLNGIFVKTTVKMSSAQRGQYKDECFVFGAVVDNESRWFAIHMSQSVMRIRPPTGQSGTNSKVFGSRIKPG